MAEVKKESISERNLKPYLDMGFEVAGNVDQEVFGTCVFCGRESKLYINLEKQVHSCKSLHCDKKGNLYSFIQQFFELHADTATEEDWEALADNRKLPLDLLQAVGIVYDGSQWWIPARNEKGTYLNAYRYTLGRQVVGLSRVTHALFGGEEFGVDTHSAYPVYNCEGPWDRIAMMALLRDEGENGVVVAVPGAGNFTDKWAECFSGRDVINCYDNDLPGEKGTGKVYAKLKDKARTFQRICWPEGLPEGFDLRDYYQTGKGLGFLYEVISEYVPTEEVGEDTDEEEPPELSFPLLKHGGRPSLQSVFTTFRKHLHITKDLEDGARIVFAVILSNQIPGDPLWVHLVAPPGGGKTQLLQSVRECPQVIMRSSLTAHTLVSGYETKKGPDPSLLPELLGPPSKTFVLKDFTEVLQMNKTSKDEIYKTLRGAFDGETIHQFGNAVLRAYRGRFSMITGVTPSIFREQAAMLGERFLIYYMPNDPETAHKMIMAALNNIGKKDEIDRELQQAAISFLSYRIEEDDWPVVPQYYNERIAALAMLVAMLRANVEKDRYGGLERLSHRPQVEIATRLSIQLQKLLIGLGLQNNPVRITDDDYRIVTRVGLNSCIGFNLEAIRYLYTRKDGATTDEVMEATGVPRGTIYDHLMDLYHLEVLSRTEHPNPSNTGRGSNIYRFHLSRDVKRFWEEAELAKFLPGATLKPLPRRRPQVASRRGGGVSGATPEPRGAVQGLSAIPGAMNGSRSTPTAEPEEEDNGRRQPAPNGRRPLVIPRKRS